MNVTETEPLSLTAAIKLAVVGVATAAVIALDLDGTLSAAIVGAASACAVLLGVIIERAMVYSPATYKQDVETALYTEPPKE